MSIVKTCCVATLALLLACSKSSSDSGLSKSGSALGSAAIATDAAVPTAPHAVGYHAESLGALRFATSGGTAEARALFDRGLLALHSFWYEEATKQFQAAISTDPTFAMAYWGLAMSKAKLLWGDDDVSGGRSALARIPTPQQLPAREQAWVMAAVSLFNANDVQTSRRDFLATMEKLHAYVQDDESALFLAVALLSTIRPGAPDELVLRERAATLAMEVFKRNPKHPGAAHYIIHAYDTPALAENALPAARLYASIAPAAFHAQHMPAHIFGRLGMWKDASTSCQAAWDASVAWAAREKLSAEHHDFHSLAWLVEIAFERGRRRDAERALDIYADAVRGGLSHGKRAAYANQVMSFLARTGEWSRVDELLQPLAAQPTDAPAGTAGDATCGKHAPAPSGPPTHLFERRAVLGVRARAAAMQRDLALVKRTLDERDAVDAELRPFLVATQPAELVTTADTVRGLVRKELVARARGDDRALLAALRPLATDQKHEFTGEGMPGGLLYQEEIADALLRLGKPRDALAAYRLVLAEHAGRARSMLGAARAAAKVGDVATSREYYTKLLALWADADPNTDGLVEARANAAP